jgi:hypothetical protein
MWVPGVGEERIARWMGEMGVLRWRRRGRGYLKGARAERGARALGGKCFGRNATVTASSQLLPSRPNVSGARLSRPHMAVGLFAHCFAGKLVGERVLAV